MDALHQSEIPSTRESKNQTEAPADLINQTEVSDAGVPSDEESLMFQDKGDGDSPPASSEVVQTEHWPTDDSTNTTTKTCSISTEEVPDSA